MMLTALVLILLVGNACAKQPICHANCAQTTGHTQTTPIQRSGPTSRSAITNKFDASIFNTLPNIEELASKPSFSSLEQKIQNGVAEGAKIIFKHGVEAFVGLNAPLHKHFDLESNERMVFTEWKTSFETDNIALVGSPVPKESLDTKNCTMLPYLFKLVEGNEWTPLQYMLSCRKTQVGNGANGKDGFFEELSKFDGAFSSFLNEMSHFLTNSGLIDQVGLYWRYDIPKIANTSRSQLVEETWASHRVQTFKAFKSAKEFDAPKESQMIVTHYGFSTVRSDELCTGNTLLSGLQAACVQLPERSCRRVCFTSDPHQRSHSSTGGGGPTTVPTFAPSIQ